MPEKWIEDSRNGDWIIDRMDKDRETGKYCDIKIVVENKEFYAHRAVLAACSPYFELMFSGSYAEAQQSCITLETIESSAFEIILGYLYKNCVQITDKNFQAVVHGAHLLQISSMVKNCCYFLEMNIANENCIGFYNYARLYMNNSLQEKSRKYWINHFVKVSLEEEFLEADVEDLIGVISDEDLFVENEDEVFEAIMRWFLSKEEERTPFLYQVLSHVRLAHVSPNRLKQHTDNIDAFKKSDVCKNLLNKTLWYHMMPQMVKLETPLTKRRPSWPVEVLVLVVNNPDRIIDQYRELCLSETGTVVKEVKCEYYDGYYDRRCNDYCCRDDDEYYDDTAFGFHVVSYDETIAGVWQGSPGIYNKKSCHFNDSLSYCHLRRKCDFAYLDGDWYVIGGREKHEYGEFTNRVSRIDAVTKKFADVDPLPFAVHNSTVVTYKGMIYVFGIRNDPALHKAKKLAVPEADKRQMYLFNPATGLWESCGDLNHIFVSGPSVFKGKMYVLTEQRPYCRRCLERYSSLTATWSVFAEFPGSTPLLLIGYLVVRCFREKEQYAWSKLMDGEQNKKIKVRVLKN